MNTVVNQLTVRYQNAVDHTYAKEVDAYRRMESNALPLALSIVTSDHA